MIDPLKPKLIVLIFVIAGFLFSFQTYISHISPTTMDRQNEASIIDNNQGNLTACNACREMCEESVGTQPLFLPDSVVARLLTLGHLNCIKHLVQQRPESTETLLLGAAAFGHNDCLQVIVSCVGLETLLGNGRLATKAVHMAARRGQYEVLEILLDIGVHPDLRLDTGPPGLTATYLAAANGHPTCLKLLLEAGGRGSLVPGTCPLYGAVINRHMDCAMMLLNYKVWGCDQGGQMLQRLASEGNVTYLETITNNLTELGLQEIHKEPLVRSIHIPILRDDIQAAARKTARAGQADCLKVLLYSAFSDIYSVSSVQDLIYEAASNGHLNCLTTILESAITVNVDDSTVASVQMGHFDCLKMLCGQNPAGIPARDEAILQSAVKGHIVCLHFLLEYSTSCLPDNMCPSILEEALAGAAAEGHFECLELLLMHKLTDCSSCSYEVVEKATLASTESGHLSCLKLIHVKLKDKISFNAYYNAIHLASALGRIDCLRLLLAENFQFRNRCPCNALYKLKETLVEAAVLGHYDCAELIKVERKLSVDGDSILLGRHLVAAAAVGNCEGLTALLKLGASPNSAVTQWMFGPGWWSEHVYSLYESFGYETRTRLAEAEVALSCLKAEAPLFAAVRMNMFSCSKILLEWGANPNIVDNKGDSPLTHASSHGRPEIVKLLFTTRRPSRPMSWLKSNNST